MAKWREILQFIHRNKRLSVLIAKKLQQIQKRPNSEQKPEQRMRTEFTEEIKTIFKPIKRSPSSLLIREVHTKIWDFIFIC